MVLRFCSWWGVNFPVFLSSINLMDFALTRLSAALHGLGCWRKINTKLSSSRLSAHVSNWLICQRSKDIWDCSRFWRKIVFSSNSWLLKLDYEHTCQSGQFGKDQMAISICFKLTRAQRTCNFVVPHITSKTSLRSTLFSLNWLPPTFGHLPEDGNVQGSKRGKRGSVANILNSVNITITAKLQGELEKRGVSQYFWRDTNIVISSGDDTR